MGWYNEPIAYRKQNINIINTELKGLLGIKESPISYNKSMKRYESDIKIKCYDADMKLWMHNTMTTRSEILQGIGKILMRSLVENKTSKGRGTTTNLFLTMDVYHSDEFVAVHRPFCLFYHRMNRYFFIEII